MKEPQVEEHDELSDDEISYEFVPVEDGEANTVEISEPNDDNETNAFVESNERNNDDRMSATVVDERNNGNKKEWEQLDNSVIIIDD